MANLSDKGRCCSLVTIVGIASSFLVELPFFRFAAIDTFRRSTLDRPSFTLVLLTFISFFFQALFACCSNMAPFLVSLLVSCLALGVEAGGRGLMPELRAPIRKSLRSNATEGRAQKRWHGVETGTGNEDVHLWPNKKITYAFEEEMFSKPMEKHFRSAFELWSNMGLAADEFTYEEVSLSACEAGVLPGPFFSFSFSFSFIFRLLQPISKCTISSSMIRNKTNETGWACDGRSREMSFGQVRERWKSCNSRCPFARHSPI